MPRVVKAVTDVIGRTDPWIHTRCGGTARHGTARHGTARHGTARHGTARHGTARHGTARHGTARHGTARHGTARHGTARHGTAVCFCQCQNVLRAYNVLLSSVVFLDSVSSVSNTTNIYSHCLKCIYPKRVLFNQKLNNYVACNCRKNIAHMGPFYLTLTPWSSPCHKSRVRYP